MTPVLVAVQRLLMWSINELIQNLLGDTRKRIFLAIVQPFDIVRSTGLVCHSILSELRRRIDLPLLLDGFCAEQTVIPTERAHCLFNPTLKRTI